MKRESTHKIPTKHTSTIEVVQQNVRKSFMLICLMVIVILLISYAIGYYGYRDPVAGLWIGALVTVIAIPIQLLTAKAAILSMTRGKKADPTVEKEALVIHLVESVTLASGLRKTPDVYIVPSSTLNAFASGMSEKNALIGVTQGLINSLNKQELEGVIAHEISHIVHKDVLLSTIAVSLVSIIMMLSFVLSRVLLFGGAGRSRRKNDNAGLVFLVIAIVAILIRPLAMLAANLLQMGISRKREFAADAHAVRLCGHSLGLISALKKIGGVAAYTQQQTQSLGGEQLKCLYINFPSARGAFSTHPPIDKRIEVLEQIY